MTLPATPASAASAASPGVTGAPLDIPKDFADKLDAAVAEGVEDANVFLREHAPSERWMVPAWALLRMKWPPKDDKPELAFLHEVAGARTPAGVERAKYWASHGLTDEWEALLEEYTRRVGPRQAQAARKLLHDALMMVNNVTQTAKAGAARQRPFVVDPTLPLAVDRPGNNPSYPSGHTTAAFAASLVLAQLMPDRRDEFMGNAREASWARVYAGVHFPSDVLAGAKLATTVTTHLIRTSRVRPLRGTKNPGVAGSKRPGIAGPRAALAGAVQLAGTPIGASPAAAVIGRGQAGS